MTQEQAIMWLRQELDKDDCLIELPYNVAAGILRLLKAQEPRMMTLDEAKSVEGYVWVEYRDINILSVSLFRNGFLVNPFAVSIAIDSINWSDYNKWWRYWTSCPTDEQMEAIPWN